MKVLCAVDGSEFSHRAVEALASLVGLGLDEVVLLHVVETGLLPSARAGKARVKASLAAVDREAEKLLQRMAATAVAALSQSATAPRTAVRTVLAHGPVAETIVRQAGRRLVDLVMVGSQGLSDIRSFLLGSVSRKVVSLAACPVLVVKRRLPQIARVVLAVDGSKHAKTAADFLRRRLLPESAHLVALSVVPPVVTDLAARVLSQSQMEALTKPLEERASRIVTAFREAFIKEGGAVTTEVLAGSPSQVIVDYARQTRADLVAVGSRGLTGTDRLLLGSVSEGILKYAPCSVLIVRGRAG